MSGEQVTIWWVDHHFGMSPPTLESAEGWKTAKQVRYKARFGGNSVLPIERAHFTPQDAIADARQYTRRKLSNAEHEAREYRAALAMLDEIEKKVGLT